MTRGDRGLQGVTGGCKGLQGVTRGYRGLQGVTAGYKGFQEVTSVFQRVTMGDRGLQVCYNGVTRGDRG